MNAQQIIDDFEHLRWRIDKAVSGTHKERADWFNYMFMVERSW